jgi:hypothetical protein
MNLKFIQPAFIVLAIVGGVIVGGIVVFAIASDYPGSINLQIGTDGIQVQINGHRDKSLPSSQ